MTNLDISGIDIITTTLSLAVDGTVTKVQRINAVLSQSFDARMFPFDTQNLSVELGSTVLTQDDLILTPINSSSVNGFRKGAFDATDFEVESIDGNGDFRMGTFSMIDTGVTKSGGSLQITVSRDASVYWPETFAPSLMLVAFAWTVFLFPISHAFIVPRVMTTMIAFMSSVVLGIRTARLLPVSSGTKWIVTFEEMCNALIFSTSLLNILTQVTAHELELKRLASRFDLEATFGFPFLAIAILGTLFICGHFRLVSADGLPTLAFACGLTIVVVMTMYLILSSWRVFRTRKAMKSHLQPQDDA